MEPNTDGINISGSFKSRTFQKLKIKCFYYLVHKTNLFTNQPESVRSEEICGEGGFSKLVKNSWADLKWRLRSFEEQAYLLLCWISLGFSPSRLSAEHLWISGIVWNGSFPNYTNHVPFCCYTPNKNYILVLFIYIVCFYAHIDTSYTVLKSLYSVCVGSSWNMNM